MNRIILIAGVVATLHSFAQKPTDVQRPTREFGVLFGLSQPVLGRGFNYEFNYFTKRWVFDFSHGGALRLENAAIVGDMNRQQLAAYVPITIGFGAGYRFTDWLNLRVEPKLHRFRIHYEGELNNRATQIAAYNTYTLGLGLYGKIMPFRSSAGPLKGITIAPSVRWWPTVVSSLADDKLTYNNVRTGEPEIHRAMNIGLNNTPLIVNVSVGYLFGRR